MTFPAQMRLGSLETLGAMALLAVVALRMRSTPHTFAMPVAQAIRLQVEHQGRTRTFEGRLPVLMGRAAEADLLILDPEMSRRHATLEAEGGTIFLSDLRSRNGTFLNERQIRESIEVRPGDHIDMGNTRVTFLGSAPWK